MQLWIIYSEPINNRIIIIWPEFYYPDIPYWHYHSTLLHPQSATWHTSSALCNKSLSTMKSFYMMVRQSAWCDVILHDGASICMMWCHVAWWCVNLHDVMSICMMWCQSAWCDVILHFIPQSADSMALFIVTTVISHDFVFWSCHSERYIHFISQTFCQHYYQIMGFTEVSLSTWSMLWAYELIKHCCKCSRVIYFLGCFYIAKICQHQLIIYSYVYRCI